MSFYVIEGECKVTEWTIRIPVRDPSELISARACSELPEHLPDGEDADVARGILQFFHEVAGPRGCTVGQVIEVIESFEPAERKQLLRAVRRRVGLSDPNEIDWAERMERETRRGRERVAATHDRPLRLAIREGGAIVDLDEVEADAAAERARAASLKARRAAERADREAEAQPALAHQAARDEQARRELPEHFRGPSA